MIFLSYAREDKPWAARVTTALRAQARQVESDPPLVQGHPFWREMVRARLRRSRSMVVLWSSLAARSPWVDQEIREFRGPKLFLSVGAAPLPPGEATEAAGGPGASTTALPLVQWLEQARLRRAAAPVPNAPSGDAAADAQVSRRRAACFVAERDRLERFLRGIAERPREAARVENGTAQLADGTRLIRLPAEISGGDMVHLAATPVTNAQYRRFVEATGYASPPTWARAAFRRPDAPVVGVTWFEAMAYAAWCGGDLPSRAEWEWAATGGDPGVEYGTAQGRLSQAMAHFGVALGEGAPCPSEAYPPNRLAFSGMCGNTWDWCRTSDGSHQVICGGGYMDAALFCRARAAYRNAAIDRDCCVGFRIRIVLR